MNIRDTETSQRKYCFDISGIVSFLSTHRKYTGIQRVVVMAAWSFYHNLPDQQKDNVYVGFQDRLTGQYRCAKFLQVRDSIKDPDLLSEALSIKTNRKDGKESKLKFLEKYRKRPIKYYFHLWRLDVLSMLGKDEPFLKLNTDSKGWKQIRNGQAGTDEPVSKVDFANANSVLKSNDILFLLDAAWQSSHTRKMKEMASMGIKTLTMVHDLIPLKLTGYTEPSIPNSFFNWLMNTQTHTSAYLAVSKSTSTDLREFLNSLSIDRDIHIVPLVQGFDHPIDQPIDDNLDGEDLSGNIKRNAYSKFFKFTDLDENVRMYEHTPFILCVGTIEIRKNPLRLLQAWKQLIEKSGGDIPRLVFAGRTGWLIDDFKTALEASGNLSGYIDIIEQPTDMELSFLYRNCMFLVMPSIYEGWGLPVGEALSFGKTAIISNTSSLPEVGQDLVMYCDPTSVSNIAEAVWKLVSEPEERILLENKIKTTKLRGWHDVGNDLIEISKKI